MRASRWLLAVIIVASAFAIGAIHALTLCLLLPFVALAAVTAWWRSEPINVRPAASLLLFTGIGLVAYTLLQCVPIPIRMLAAVAPQNADVWARALVPLHDPGPSWAPLTIDPPGSRIELLRGVAYLLTFVAALRIAARREGVAFLSNTIVVTGVLLALSALLHPAFGAKKVFGIYEPGPGIMDSDIAPLLNPNNLAGYLNIAFCLILATSLSREGSVPRAIALSLVAFLGATQVWIASRGGVIAMLLGAGTVGALTLSEKVRRRDPRTWVTVGCGTTMLIGGVAIVLASSEKAQTGLLSANLSKFALLVQVGKMLAVYGLFGSGRGSFESAFSHFREVPGHLVFTNPENVVGQWVSEWGVPVGLVGLALVVLALRPTAALARSRTAVGAWAALAAIGAQNLADFSSEIPGVMFSVVVCAAIVVAGSAGLAPRWRLERWSRSPRLVSRVSVVAGLFALGAGLSALGRHLHDDQRRVHDAVLVRGAPADEVRALARAAILRHPAEPYFPFAVALRDLRGRDENPLPWLGATLERAPVYGGAHLLIARAVAARSPSQARLEYRVALEQAFESAGFVVQESPRLVGSYDDAMELVSKGESGVYMLRALSDALSNRLPATCARLDRELSDRVPEDPGPWRHRATDAVADLEHGAGVSWCDGPLRAACVDHAVELARRLEDNLPVSCEGYNLEARALAAGGRAVPAMDRLEEVAERVTDRVECLKAQADLARSVRDDVRFNRVLDEIGRAGCADRSRCVDNLVWVAQALEPRGESARALQTYRRAFDKAPEMDVLLENMARLATATGLNVEAFKDYQELARRHPADGRWVKAAEQEREAIVRGRPNF
jgi:tetratricopeptide (TPR) repeat protein